MCPCRQRAMLQQQAARGYVQPVNRRFYDQAGMVRSYGLNYEHGERYEELTSRRPASSAYSREIIRSLEELELNRIQERRPPARIPARFQSQQYIHNRHYGSYTCERPYATLPRRSRSHSTVVNLEEHFQPRDLQRLSRYPKSLQDLKYLEIEAILGRDPAPPRRDPLLLDDRPSRSRAARARNAELRRNWARSNEAEHDRLVLEALAASGSQLERYEPGKVHYEREYRIYGKDTVALIFYKTCYL